MSKYSDAIISANPISYWRMDDESSIMVDMMGNHNGTHVSRSLGSVGAIVGDETLSSEYTSADVGGSQVPLHSDFTTPSFSFELWIKFEQDAIDQYQYIISQQNNASSSGNRFAFTMGNAAGNDTILRIWLNNGSWVGTDINLTYITEYWYHLAITYDDSQSQLKAYVNGNLEQTASISSLTIPTCPLTIATLYSSSSSDVFSLDGNIQDIAYYDRVINEQEIKQHWFLGRRYGSNYEYEIIRSRPIIYWRMDDIVGNSYIKDDISHKHLTTSGNPVAGYTPLINHGSCIDFNSNYANATHTIDLSSGELTVEAWVNFDSLGSRNYIVTRQDNISGYVQFALEVTNLGVVKFHIQRGSDNTYFNIESSPAISLNTTYHIVATWGKGSYDVTDFGLYINGSSVPILLNVSGGTYNSSFSLPVISNLIEIGRRNFEPGNLIDGRIDQVSIYNRKLSQTESQIHYNSGLGTQQAYLSYDEMISSDGALHHWKFDFTSTDIIGDNSGSLDTGSLTPAGIISPNINNGSQFSNTTISINPLSLDDTWSVEFWCLLDPSFSYQTVIDNNDLGIFVYNNLLTYYNLGADLGTIDIGNRAVHCVVTFDGTEGRFYVNGVLDSTFSNPSSTWNPTRIGGDSGSENINGLLQSLSVFDNVLTEQQVYDHYLRGVTDGVFVVFSIQGQALVNGTEQPCVVRAYRVDDGSLAAENLSSDIDGTYNLTNLEENVEYVVLCLPPDGSGVCPQVRGIFLAGDDGVPSLSE